MHVSCACLTSHRLENYSGHFFHVVWPSVVLHGFFDFQIMLVSACVASGILSDFSAKTISVIGSTILVMLGWRICSRALHGKLVANAYQTV